MNRQGTRRSVCSRSLRWILVGILACASGMSWTSAQAAEVRASVDRTRIRLGDSLTLTIEVAGGGSDRVAAPDISKLSDFEIARGPVRSHRFQFVNGVSSSSVTYQYVLVPRREGTLSVPPLRLLVRGRMVATQRIRVEVLPRGSAPPRPRAPAPGVQQDRRLRSRGTREAPSIDDVRVLAEVDTSSVFVGQQVTLAVMLVSRQELLGLAPKDSPTFPGFWAEEIKLPENYNAEQILIDGVPHIRYTLMKRALFPTNAGTLTIPPVTYQIQIKRRSRDPIESFFFTPVETIVRGSSPIAVEVAPLPTESRPADFSGAVGRFDLSVVADRTTSSVNDAIGLEVRIAGVGNLRTISEAPLPELTDFKEFTPKVTEQMRIRGDRLLGEKSWDYVLIPLAPGEQTIPSITFSFFDPAAGEYRTVGSQPITIQVARGDGAPGSPYTPVAQSDVRQLRQDIHYIKLAPDGLRDRSRPFYRSPVFLVILLLPVAADVGIFAAAFRRERRHANSRLRRERRARSIARRRLKDARKLLTPHSSRAFYASVAQALTEYVADKFDTAASGLTHQRIEELLSSHGAPDDLKDSYHRCLEACDYARFAPTSSSEEEMKRTSRVAEEMLVALERSLTK